MRDRDGTLDAQRAMLRLAERDYGITPKRLNLETHIPLPTILSWKRDVAPAMIGLADFVALCRVIPDDLTSLCLEGAGKHIGTNGDGEGDLDTVATVANDYTHEYGKARHPQSPGGVQIVPQEAAKLHDIRGRLCAQSRRAA